MGLVGFGRIGIAGSLECGVVEFGSVWQERFGRVVSGGVRFGRSGDV